MARPIRRPSRADLNFRVVLLLLRSLWRANITVYNKERVRFVAGFSANVLRKEKNVLRCLCRHVSSEAIMLWDKHALLLLLVWLFNKRSENSELENDT